MMKKDFGQFKSRTALKLFLDEMADQYNNVQFITDDPIFIPHQFSKKEDIEIAAFLTASISWGNRKAILKGAKEMMNLMDHQPYAFVMGHNKRELESLSRFVYRTFNGSDFQQFIISLRHIYANHQGLEFLFSEKLKGQQNPGSAISVFKQKFFEKNKSPRSIKHVADPLSGSSAKRLNMFLRWMVRSDSRGVDFGIWKSISPAQLSIPLDVHTGNMARRLGILERKQNDWKAVEELDLSLREFNAADPVRYDFALFGLGAIGKF